MFNVKNALAASMLAALSLNAAMAGTLIAPGAKPIKVTKAQLAIKGPITNACPTNAKMALWLFTNKPGKVEYMIAKKGGQVSGPYTIQSVKGANGISMASFSKNLAIHQAIDTEYRILVGKKYGLVMSSWVPLKASCKIQLGG